VTRSTPELDEGEASVGARSAPAPLPLASKASTADRGRPSGPSQYRKGPKRAREGRADPPRDPPTVYTSARRRPCSALAAPCSTRGGRIAAGPRRSCAAAARALPCRAGRTARRSRIPARGSLCLAGQRSSRLEVGSSAAAEGRGWRRSGRRIRWSWREAVDIAQVPLAVEVAQRERREQPPVLAARVLAHAVTTRAGVAIEPRSASACSVGPRRSARAFASRESLDRPRLGECRRRLPALTASRKVDHNEARTAPVPARKPRPLE
jgi:hypothetical protein